MATFSKTHGPNVIRRSLRADAPAPRVHQHRAPHQYRQPWPLPVSSPPNAPSFHPRNAAHPLAYKEPALTSEKAPTNPAERPACLQAATTLHSEDSEKRCDTTLHSST